MPTQRDHRDVLKVLEMEERFLRAGGYDNAPATRSAGPSLIFQDSPVCPNSGSSLRHVACTDCTLIQLVPRDKMNEPVPCRHIPLNDIGETVDTLYRWGTFEETKMILADWLRRTISEMRFMRNRMHPEGKESGKNIHAPEGT